MEEYLESILLKIYCTFSGRTIYGSFGGLMMSLTGSKENLKDFKMDSDVYLFMKKL